MKIEEEMKRIVKEDPEFVREEMSLDEAIVLFGKIGQSYKVELLNDLKTKGTTKMAPEEATDLDPANPAVASILPYRRFCRSMSRSSRRQSVGDRRVEAHESRGRILARQSGKSADATNIRLVFRYTGGVRGASKDDGRSGKTRSSHNRTGARAF